MLRNLLGLVVALALLVLPSLGLAGKEVSKWGQNGIRVKATRTLPNGMRITHQYYQLRDARGRFMKKVALPATYRGVPGGRR
jgi:hypothetical protein